ncbi:MAG: hypothetical protein JNG90_08545 [Planctomycetaceae bacterium]|nr:hypothetical protein [Planctomycetaceae bacterium]
MTLETGSRLHFGLLSFGQAGVRAFGGVGAMIDRPAIRLRVERSAHFACAGEEAERVAAFVERLARRWRLASLPACRVTVESMPRAHVGLGTGTQLGLAVAAAVGAWLGRPSPAPDALAALVGRGERSAIGTWGFARGGLLIEGGHDPSAAPAASPISPLLVRQELPQHWRWVLLTPALSAGLSGAAERAAFARLPPVPVAVTRQLCDELWHELIPAATAGDFDRFSQSLYRYGVAAGNCFALVQGGAFANAWVAEAVAAIRAKGVAGVGQSSWGPTVFALLPDETAARDLVASLTRLPVAANAEIVIAATRHTGARCELQG